MTVVKVSFNIPEDMLRGLKRLAEDEGITATEAFRRAIRTDQFFRDEAARGNRLLVEDADRKKAREVFLP